MNYTETLDYLFNSLPMYHRVGKAAYKADITHTVQLMDHLSHPERQFRSIHVAGTNGKGSVCHSLAAILQREGYKVGLYTSPHLVDFRERIRINGEMIPREKVVDFVARHRSFMETLDLSFFEMTVGLAFDYFASERVDVAVVEVGMGGRLDSTNVITPLISVITNIGFDHTQFLGDTLPKIAAEKAGIIKEGVPVVIGETHTETEPVFLSTAAERHAPIFFADQNPDFCFPQFSLKRLNVAPFNVSPQLQGSYQRKNVTTLMQVVDLLPTVGLDVSLQSVQDGVANVVTDTGLHGRWETIAESPLTICETAHNADGIRAMLEKIATMRYRNLRFVYGCVNDKDFGSILQMFPREATFYFTQPSVPRRLPVSELVLAAHQMGIDGPAFDNVGEAIDKARLESCPDDLVIVTGSIFLVADAMEPLLSEKTATEV